MFGECVDLEADRVRFRGIPSAFVQAMLECARFLREAAVRRTPQMHH